jgi:phage terminase large subunit
MHIANAISRPGYRALCLRQVQKSIKESSKHLLEERIQHYGLGRHFGVYDQEIRCPGGGQMVFHGLQDHTAESIKSFEGFDVADIEEGQTIRQRSLDLLVPTIIRKPGAEVWARWNPRLDTDAIDKFFRGGKPPPNSECVEIGWKDNPWLSPEVRAQIAADYEADPEKAEHIWGGGYEIITEGSYYAKLLAIADKEGRIGSVPWDEERVVNTAWDIGVDDYTAIWFLQDDGRQVRAIDYYETSGDGAELIVEDALRSKPYRYGDHFLPHDVRVREWGAGAKSRYQTLIDLGLKNIRVGVAQGPVERINATRAILPIVSFDKENCALGIKRMRNYRRRKNETMGTYGGPEHDEASHAADAFGEFAVNCSIRPRPKEEAPARMTDYTAREPERAAWSL